ncbi:DNA mismatch repair protein MutT [Bacillus sp. MUM 116]|uniref:NUDIX domain-containing protein n=1 Tax=Bacillus sp. MUM 116 TaxID=1678002 RepID=UPI0008F5C09B|nr:NUDIX domain-containing protein [Bacillus sp. MUM 116]OIK10869.1 DNA mismatch repair protein MutT [Bacillus sp. MUM 116]
MGYCEDIREMIGDSPLIIVRPSVAIINDKREILLSRNVGGMWTIPGGTLQLNESVEECITRIVFENIGVKIKVLKLLGVYSGKELINRVDERYHTVAIGYLCTEYEGEITPQSDTGIEARFFRLNQLPEEVEPFIKNKLIELKGHLKK